jgi:hypothetical protein
MEQDWLREQSRALRERLDRRLEEADAVRREWNRSRSEGPGEDREVGLEQDPPKPPDPERQ